MLLYVQCNAQYWIDYKITLMRLFSAPEIFIPDAHTVRKTGAENWRPKIKLICGAGFWSVWHGHLVCARSGHGGI